MGKFVHAKSFLDRVSGDLYDRYGSDISRLCLVFPSRRARLFFAESLSAHIAKPLWQPESLSISELIYKWAGRRPSDSLRLLAELYKIWAEASSAPTTTFDQFYFWGEMLLHDFDQVDKYLVPAKKLFQNLQDQKKLEGDYSFLTPQQVEAVQMFWGSFQPQKTELQESFIQMWEVMYPLYSRFRHALEEQGLAYEGMLYRQVAEQEELSIPDSSILSYVFIGFNALNACERTLFKRLQKQNRALFYWDRDDYYLNDPCQEAGLFLRKNMEEFPPADLDAVYSDFSQPKEIESWTLPSDVLQAKIVPKIIQDNHLHTDKCTAVVLCDESLLIPLLSALPQVTADINVTMGYPLTKTSLYSFTEALLLFYRSARLRGGSCTYYHVEVSRLLSHPFISHLCPQAAEEIKKRIIAENILFVPMELFIIDNWLMRISDCPQSPDNWLAFFLELLEAVEEAVLASETPDPLLLPVLRLAALELNKCRSAIQTCGLEMGMPLFFNLLRQTLRSVSVPFNGEPLRGVQVMGFLETRALDFEHVVLLSAQEGALPSAREAPSFIPYNLKAGFGLPVREEHEAMYAYYFYRLLQRAQKVSLLYGAGTDAMLSGEQSRYLLQLSAESPHTIVHKRLALSVTLPVAPPQIEQQKIGLYKDRLLRYLDPHSDRFLTPSAINTYLQCPLQFCFHHIENLKEEQEVMEEADGRSMGTILHGVMESLYRPFLGHIITTRTLELLLKDQTRIRQDVEEKIRHHYARGNSSAPIFEQGRWLILADVVTTYVAQAIRYDIAQTPFTLKAIETRIKTLFRASSQLSIPLGGVVDRIQEKEGVCYVVDYKTGKDQRTFGSIQALFAPERSAQNSAVFQILWYAIFYQEISKREKTVPLLYYIRSLFDPTASALLYDKSVKQKIDDIAPYLEAYRALLGQKLTELFDLSQPFTQTTDREHCIYCNYNPICRRE
ncbi:MAG: PD-(D/E)XK nuclease family protein [Bacteroidales bacterium]|nr:PD-(D/E)XK nuclease family protein [Bacteroidales bacterium]